MSESGRGGGGRERERVSDVLSSPMEAPRCVGNYTGAPHGHMYSLYTIYSILK
jgi:hypothetical protein